MIRTLSVLGTLLGVALLSACGGFKSDWPTVTGVSPQTVSVTVNCVAEQAKALGYDVRAGTRSHYQTRRGTTPTDEPASDAAKKDAQTIATACGGGTG